MATPTQQQIVDALLERSEQYPYADDRALDSAERLGIGDDVSALQRHADGAHADGAHAA